MQENNNQEKELSIKQTRAITALLISKDIQSAASEASISESTLHRWLDKDVAFKAALKAAEAEAVAGAVRRLSGTATHAVTVLLMVMSDPKHPASVRLRAAIAVLDQLIKLKSFADLEGRVAVLEEMAKATAKNEAQPTY